jgi:hypothetical protein
MGADGQEDFDTLRRMESDSSSIDPSDVVDVQRVLKLAFPPDGDEAQSVYGRQAIAHTMARMQLWTSGSTRPQLQDVIGEARQALLKIRLTDTGESAFPDASVYAFSRSECLPLRFKMAAICLRLQHDPELGVAGLDTLVDTGDPGFIFGSSHELIDGVYVFDAYLAPLFGSLAPFVWAFPASRGGVTVIYTFGRALSGTDGLPAVPLQAIAFRGADSTIETPVLDAGSCESALQWWALKVDAFMAVVSDPATYTDATGAFRPEKQLYAILSVEQVFRRVAAVQRSHHDKDARRVAFFSVLDTLERLTGRDIAYMCRPTSVQQILLRLRSSVPVDAQKILMPACERGAKALSELTEGFFLPRQRGRTTLNYADESGVQRALSLEEATAQYVKLLRDATHGFGGKVNIKRGEALLVQHNGKVPHDLAFLAWLHFLDLITSPDRLRHSLWRGGAT